MAGHSPVVSVEVAVQVQVPVVSTVGVISDEVNVQVVW